MCYCDPAPDTRQQYTCAKDKYCWGNQTCKSYAECKNNDFETTEICMYTNNTDDIICSKVLENGFKAPTYYWDDGCKTAPKCKNSELSLIENPCLCGSENCDVNNATFCNAELKCNGKHNSTVFVNIGACVTNLITTKLCKCSSTKFCDVNEVCVDNECKSTASFPTCSSNNTKTNCKYDDVMCPLGKCSKLDPCDQNKVGKISTRCKCGAYNFYCAAGKFCYSDRCNNVKNPNAGNGGSGGDGGFDPIPSGSAVMNVFCVMIFMTMVLY